MMWMDIKLQTDNPIYIQQLCSKKVKQSENFAGFVIYITYKHMPYIDILPRIITMLE